MTTTETYAQEIARLVAEGNFDAVPCDGNWHLDPESIGVKILVDLDEGCVTVLYPDAAGYFDPNHTTREEAFIPGIEDDEPTDVEDPLHDDWKFHAELEAGL
jgi:hypothetical protein